ncbi:hypothetical protein QBC35DRAFT_509991 [Podospora australis]|uniref:Uncharacterized protein n=1 Tax=Podospora australis TaxID=1536484 RepID=A0AAN6WIG6_9PEZI|nr:hypothetical protein QBC35DRAFT_509991 [Podospora australis]
METGLEAAFERAIVGLEERVARTKLTSTSHEGGRRSSYSAIAGYLQGNQTSVGGGPTLSMAGTSGTGFSMADRHVYMNQTKSPHTASGEVLASMRVRDEVQAEVRTRAQAQGSILAAQVVAQAKNKDLKPEHIETLGRFQAEAVALARAEPPVTQAQIEDLFKGGPIPGWVQGYLQGLGDAGEQAEMRARIAEMIDQKREKIRTRRLAKVNEAEATQTEKSVRKGSRMANRLVGKERRLVREQAAKAKREEFTAKGKVGEEAITKLRAQVSGRVRNQAAGAVGPPKSNSRSSAPRPAGDFLRPECLGIADLRLSTEVSGVAGTGASATAAPLEAFTPSMAGPHNVLEGNFPAMISDMPLATSQTSAPLQVVDSKGFGLGSLHGTNSHFAAHSDAALQPRYQLSNDFNMMGFGASPVFDPGVPVANMYFDQSQGQVQGQIGASTSDQLGLWPSEIQEMGGTMTLAGEATSYYNHTDLHDNTIRASHAPFALINAVQDPSMIQAHYSTLPQNPVWQATYSGDGMQAMVQPVYEGLQQPEQPPVEYVWMEDVDMGQA